MVQAFESYLFTYWIQDSSKQILESEMSHKLRNVDNEFKLLIVRNIKIICNKSHNHLHYIPKQSCLLLIALIIIYNVISLGTWLKTNPI